ncbi:MAG TPA: preprotein translocase subunit SecG [Candidatus Paceibacterota bacterium]|nr:preprotein translocase subunit SecG [Candidatus Paceibacterota bacterium]
MAAISGILPYIQVVVSVLLIACILLQQTGASMGGAFGGDNFSAGYHTRRGSEKTFFYATMVLAAVLAALSLATLLLQ